jgi:hypothetical protein
MSKLTLKELEEQSQYSWLNLGNLANLDIRNPLLNPDRDYGRDYELEIIGLLSNPRYFGYTVELLFDRKLLPFQLAILQELWFRKFPILIATRGGGKSFILGMYALLRAIFHQGCKVVICGAAFRQSKFVFEYAEQRWQDSPYLRQIIGTGMHQGARREQDRWSFYAGKSEIIAIPIGDGCLDNLTMTTQDRGFRQLDDSTIKQCWGNGKFRNTGAFLNNGLKQTKKVRTKKGFEFEGTCNHRMKVCRNHTIQWVRADAMIVGDRILIDRTYRWHNGDFQCTEDEAYTLGFTIDNIPNNQILPQTILSAPRSLMTECIRGLMDANGSIHVSTQKNSTSICVSLCNSEKLLKQIQYILLHYGIVSCLTYRQIKENNNWHRIYKLLITEQNAVKFGQQIGFKLKDKQDILLAGIQSKSQTIPENYIVPDVPKELLDPNIYYDEIVSIEDGETHTCDIEIPDGHEYCANGFFSHNSKIRGLRANYVIADEFNSIDSEIFDVVIKGFGSVSPNPEERVKYINRIQSLKEAGEFEAAAELELSLGFGNQTIIAGTPGYAFQPLYKYWRRYKAIIESGGDKRKLEEVFDGAVPENFNWHDFSIMRLPYTSLPKGFMDEVQISQSKATTHKSHFLMEYAACFAVDSDGFFKRSSIEACTCKPNITLANGESVTYRAMLIGDKSKKYIICVDPASEDDSFCIIVLELHDNHRRIVYCWTTTRKKLRNKIKNSGKSIDEGYYSYCANKIRYLCRMFPTEHIVIDKQGGGVAIAEALADKTQLEKNELPIYQYTKYPDDPFWWEDTNKPTDNEHGLHILHLTNNANDEFLCQANHGLKFDLENKLLLFPYFDAIELANAVSEDEIRDRDYDTLEDCLLDIEELKEELTTITHTKNQRGRDSWDVPSIKLPGSKKGRLHKDRYSALMIGNMVARTMVNNYVGSREASSIGGFVGSIKHGNSGAAYYGGPAKIVESINVDAYCAVRR